MRFLFTTFEGGGHVPPALRVARVLADRGHVVRVISDEANRGQAEAASLDFASWRRAPNRRTLGAADDPLKEWSARWPPSVVRRLCEAVISGPAAAYAEDLLEAHAAFRPDVIVSNELLFGVMAAAERLEAPLALLTSNVWCFPTREDVPPFGPGFAPPRNAFEAGRERAARRMIARWYDAGLPELNAARTQLGLAPLRRLLDQLDAARAVLLGASSTFDYGRADPPIPFAYVGPLGETPAWARDDGGGEAEALLAPDRANVLVSLSTTYQAQERTLRTAVRALGGMDVNAVVTLGPALKAPGEAPPNVRLVARADHDRLVPHCAAVLCHGGHGTVMRPLMLGVPVVCAPTGRDQPENAERIQNAGAGLRLSPRPSVGAVRRAVQRVLQDPGFAARARTLGAAVAAEADGGRRAADLLEQLGRSRRARGARQERSWATPGKAF